jgi:hypothetical protein
MRSCKFPGSATSCGKAFCNSSKEVASFACDGTGSCNITLSACTGYACDDASGMCKTQCAGHDDCVGAGTYCNGMTSMCAPKKSNGISCANGAECASGNCIAAGANSVCCNTACTGAGLTCATGQCVCPGVTCGAGVSCQVFFQDADGDTFGNRAGTIAAGTARAGCAGTPPAGFVADNTDCDDGDANAKPGQTLWFDMPSKGLGTFDYNCDGMMQKETPEYVGLSCKFCGAVGSCDATTTTCTAANQTASFVCPQELAVFTKFSEELDISIQPHMSLLPPRPNINPAAQTVPPRDVVIPPGGVVLPPKLPQCCGCQAKNKTGFRSAVNCGVSGTQYTCGSCSAAGGGASAMTQSAKVQRCH